MSRASSRRPAPARTVKPKRRPQPKRQRRASILDHAVARVPGGEATVRKAAAWGITALVGGAAIAAAGWLGVFGLVGTAMAEGIGSLGFRVAQIEVTGLKRMDANSVYAVALDQRSRAMPLVDLNGTRDRLLEYGWIADARVSRRLPDTLVIDVVERDPAAVWQNNGQLMLIDHKGVLLDEVPAHAIPRLPLVIGEGANAQEPAYQRLIAAAPALRPMVKAATWVGNRRWDLLFQSGETLVLPEGEKAAANALVKFAQMDGTMGLLGKGYARFDLRDPSKLVVRMAPGAAAAPAADDAAPGNAAEGAAPAGQGNETGSVETGSTGVV
ncbi:MULTISPECIES: cell division protein FtsQ/DivIB [Sphingomonas]|jgi:cell division protein FtsQ|uniref:cell division protein FtsQ/DivIB n=1 Tax=Sphingomonas TaxID=13687 RepID=UPI000F7E37BF|nr:cell division protein FtsQ/DivIB [Sphingomonas sp. ABOLF]RSV14153.1 cell division protein FtsQ [Sphingomonas sp. ABOLF]